MDIKYETKDSGKRTEFESGFVRDSADSKPRYDLIPPELLKRLADVYARGSKKYGDNNWQKANSPEEYQRFIASAFRHFEAWRSGQEDEDHAMQCVWNIIAYEWHRHHKIKHTGHANPTASKLPADIVEPPSLRTLIQRPPLQDIIL